MQTSTKVLIIIASVVGGLFVFAVIACFFIILLTSNLFNNNTTTTQDVVSVVSTEMATQEVVSQEPVIVSTVPSEPTGVISAPQAPVVDTSLYGRTGYVVLKDTKSYLNLRTGPGTSYGYVYTTPGNKKTLVKQAYGSSVTILETVTTNDSKNPVWYKVRTYYNGYTVVGYSSANYIQVW